MDADELYDWMAFDMLKDKEFKKKVDLERSKDLDDVQRSQAIKDMFASIRGG